MRNTIIDKDISRHILSLEEYTRDPHDPRSQPIIIEKNHFSIQQVRIPLTENATIKKVMQVALNVGQALGTGAQCYATTIHDYLSPINIEKGNKKLLTSDMTKIIDYIILYILQRVNSSL